VQLGDVESGVQSLEQVMEMEVEDINAQLQKQDARLLLDEVKREGGGHWGLVVRGLWCMNLGS
jgi:hypothetical protein